MGSKDRFVDLRVLLIEPDIQRHNLLQVVLDSYRFDRLLQVSNIECASDQLMFNSFDLVIASERVPNAQQVELVEYIRSGVHGNESELPAFLFCDERGFAQEDNLITSKTGLDVTCITKSLRQAFAIANRFRNASNMPVGRKPSDLHSAC